MKKTSIIILLTILTTRLFSQSAYVLNTPALNESGANSVVTGSCTGGNNVSIRRVDLSGNPINFRTIGNTATLQLPLVINTDASTNWTAGGTSPVFSSVPTYIRFDSRDNYAYPAVSPTFLPVANKYRLEFTFTPAATNPTINFSGTANREIVSLVPANVVTPILALDGSTGGRFTAGGAFLPSPMYTLITNGVRFTGSHGSDRYNVGLQLNGTISSAIVELTELADVGLWVNSSAASIWSQIDNMGVAVSGPCVLLPIELESFTAHSNKNKATLNWKTLTEYNVLNHEIEMSKNGSDFTKIGTVKALNLASNNYSFDYNMEFNTNYNFRLKSIDYDGSYSYSKIISIQSQNTKEFIVEISPNPTSDFIKIKTANIENCYAELYNIYGVKLKNIRMFNSTNIVSMSQYPKGTYILKFINSNYEIVLKKVILE